jgi:hypothetical protein
MANFLKENALPCGFAKLLISVLTSIQRTPAPLPTLPGSDGAGRRRVAPAPSGAGGRRASRTGKLGGGGGAEVDGVHGPVGDRR